MLFIFFQFFLSVLSVPLVANSNVAQVLYESSLREDVGTRWHAFQSNRYFRPFEAGKSDATLKEEFENIQKTREFVWTTAGYELAGNLIRDDLVRAPGCVAFAYNNTVPYYNASTIFLNERFYIASEGPRSKDIPGFFKLLTTFHATHLVRLTDSYDGGLKRCHPYWTGLMSESSDGKSYLNIPTEAGVYFIRAFDMAYWRDNQGVDPNSLLDSVLEVRRESVDGLLLIHCSAGVGRTGTFLAALAIVDAIDRKGVFSVEEIVYRLSLQRVHLVSNCSQYITLHKLAEIYLKRMGS